MTIALRLIREPSEFGFTHGALYVNDRWFGWTGEDGIREPATPGLIVDRDAWVGSWKVLKATAIPAGRYPVRVTFSNRFQRPLPELFDVPGFSAIRIHSGNTHEDTEGCILVGKRRGVRAVYESVPARNELLALLADASRIFIDVENPPGRYYETPGQPRTLEA